MRGRGGRYVALARTGGRVTDLAGLPENTGEGLDPDLVDLVAAGFARQRGLVWSRDACLRQARVALLALRDAGYRVVRS